jgi:type II secretory pathway component GspD/PulD (secretin)
MIKLFVKNAMPSLVITGMMALRAAAAETNIPSSAVETTEETTRAAVITEKAAIAKAPGGTNSDMLLMNFRGASLDQVLNYLSEAAGFIINVKPGTSVKGKVDVWSSQPMTREEGLSLLDTVLAQNSLAAIRNGKVLTIVNRDEAKTQSVRVVQGSDPAKIPINDEIVTQIIPVRFVEVAQLTKDLQPLVSVQTTITANEAGNAIVITDTQANVHKVAEVIRAIDMGAEDFTELKVFHLKNADPVEMAELLSNLFPDDTKSGSGGSQSPFQGGGFMSRIASRFGGGVPGGGGAPGGGGSGGGGSGNQNQRIKKRNRVVAVAEQRTASVLVTSSKDLMEQIGEVITELDSDPKGKQIVHIIHVENADPSEVLPVLQDIFQKSGAQPSRNSSSSSSALMNRSSTQSQGTTSGRSSSSTSGATSRSGGGASGFNP